MGTQVGVRFDILFCVCACVRVARVLGVGGRGVDFFWARERERGAKGFLDTGK